MGVDAVGTRGAESARRPAGYWSQSGRRLLRDPSAVAGAILVVLIVATALIAPSVYGRDPNLIVDGGLSENGDPLGPSAEFPLGTDTTGRDELARLLEG